MGIVAVYQTLEKNDRLLLCTDGLNDMINDNQIAQILKTEPNPETACQTLISVAFQAGGLDNITTLIIDWL